MPDVDGDVEDRPRVTRTALVLGERMGLEVQPLSVPFWAEKEWLSCTNPMSMPFAAKVSRL